MTYGGQVFWKENAPPRMGGPHLRTVLGRGGGQEMSEAPDQSGQRQRLGVALEARAGEVAQRVLRVGREQGRAYYGSAEPALAEAEEQTAWATSELATRVVGRRMATGQAATAGELESLSRMGSDVAEGRTLLADVATNYLAWLEVTTAVLREEAARLDTDPAVLERPRTRSG